MARIGWYSNACHIPSGYGAQTAQVVHRLVKAGHEVAITANHGAQVMLECAHGHPIFAEGLVRYSVDAAPDNINTWIGDQPGFGVVLFDLWPLAGIDSFKDLNLACWTPIDHAPTPPMVMKFLSEGNHLAIAMSRFGEEMLLKAGQPRDELVYIPHAIDRSVFKDTGKGAREAMGVDPEAFLVVTNAANRGRIPVRKGFGEMVDVMAPLMADRKDVVWMIHTEPNGLSEGVNIPRLVAQAGIDPTRVRYPHPTQWRNGIPDTAIAAMYSAADATLLLSMGEGFGIPVVEAQSCGVPAVVTDASAQPELLGPHGRKVPGQRVWDEFQASYFTIANTGGGYAAMQELYEDTRGGVVDRSAVAASMGRYDADAVFQDSWVPLVERMTSRKRQPRQGATMPGMNRAQRRRKR
jgi:glycosyltransferase involved in cell wall biosynthesis